MKHIRMPKAIAEAWLKDLRSNPKQGFGSLKDEVTQGHCCLGRLQVVVDGDVEREECGSSRGVPSHEWLKKNNIEFLEKHGTYLGSPYYCSLGSPYCPEKGLYFTEVNDNRVPFSTIADLLEAEIEYND